MNLPQQRRYALAFLRWYKRHERRSYRLVRFWLSQVQERALAMLEKLGIQATIDRLNDLVQSESIQNVLTQIYQHTLTEAATREFDRLLTLFPAIATTNTVAAQAGFFSQRWNNIISRMLSDAQTAQRVTQITQTTRDQIRRVLVQANTENVDVRTAATRLRTLLGGKGARRRALLIARTETTRAASAGHEAGAQSTSLKLNKIWITTADSRTRESHRLMIRSKPVPKDGHFIVNGKHMKFPGDPAGGASEVCNCRCTQAYVPAT